MGGIMKTLGIALVLLVALEHLYFLYLEMFLWTTPKGLKVFGNTAEKAEASKVLAANQGLYNGFLAAGLLWGLTYPNAAAGVHIQLFFLACVIVAGVYGGMTVSKRIMFLQGGPALLGVLALLAV
jgi:putative membrane protein